MSRLGTLFGSSAQALKQQRKFDLIDLSYNRISDQGSDNLAVMISTGTFSSKINLSGNGLSAEGVRRLAQACDGCTTLGVRNVYVHKNGKIQAVGSRPARWAGEDSSIEPEKE
ncbi:MAG: hypothetical protein CMF09_09430, partial [Idiomarina sp.]|nr:hypothetical protein [Idiomarina sp.]